MTRAEAQETARRLSLKHPERAEYRWLVRQEQDGEWVVVKVSVPHGKPTDPSATGDGAVPLNKAT
jgi:hypothetical protein